MKYTPHQKQKGFTLIETLVAIFILLISITGPLTFAQGGLRSAFFARDQIVAFYLAQDATEVIKHLRDNYALGGGTGSWLTNLSGCKPGSASDSEPGPMKSCKIDTSEDNPELTACSDSNLDLCGTLYYNSTDKTYTHSSTGASLSKYSRVIHIVELVKDREAQILVEVNWEPNFFGSRRIVVQENIYNWVPAFTSDTIE